MILSATTESLELVTTSTANIAWTVSWTDYSTSATTITPGSNQGTVSSATDTTIVAAPSTNVARTVACITIRNTHATAKNTVTVQKDVSGTEYPLMPPVTLRAGEAMCFTHAAGWQVLTAQGVPRMQSANIAPPASLRLPAGFMGSTSTKTLTKGTTFGVYIGRAEWAQTLWSVRYNITTAATATVSWAEVAVAKGDLTLATNPSLTVVGYADISSTITGTGAQSVSVNLSSGQIVHEGDDLWVLLGHDGSGTTAVARACSVADELTCGFQVSATERPSLILGTGTTFSIESSAALGLWVALQ